MVVPLGFLLNCSQKGYPQKTHTYMYAYIYIYIWYHIYIYICIQMILGYPSVGPSSVLLKQPLQKPATCPLGVWWFSEQVPPILVSFERFYNFGAKRARTHDVACFLGDLFVNWVLE